MKARIARLMWALLPVAIAAHAAAPAEGPHVGPDKVVYHISDTEAQASRAMVYINNHLEANPKAKIVVVTHAFGIDFLMARQRRSCAERFC